MTLRRWQAEQAPAKQFRERGYIAEVREQPKCLFDDSEDKVHLYGRVFLELLVKCPAELVGVEYLRFASGLGWLTDEQILARLLRRLLFGRLQ